ncbi:hypothetical protein HPP92_004959 [Vanilla planifolia]|uniref:Uncharacterized protein n=1 Tax=Vanilla planifolia TaxID=51239 RepID=A0A835RT50_VANPL|nr:hypothetical protein HPP92_004959 [Vanilla planifolia]
MVSSTVDRALMLFAVFLLPLNFVSIYRSFQHPSGWRACYFRSAVLAVLFISLSTILALSELHHIPANIDTSELEEMKFQLAKLELILEESRASLDSKTLQLEESNKMIEEMDKKIESLQKTLNDAKVQNGGSSFLDERFKTMEDEVQQLWDVSRRYNFHIHISEFKVLEAEKRMDAVYSEVEKMEGVINEQWIQVQQLEQSLQMTKVMTSRAKKKASSVNHGKSQLAECPMLKFTRSLGRPSQSHLVRLPDSFFLGDSISRSFLLKTVKQFKRIMSAARKQHHELQYSIKLAMEMNEYTAPLANEELIFFLASALVVFP